METHRLLTAFLSLRAIMLIGSVGALVGSLLMFLQGGFFLHEAWHTILAEGDAVQKQVTVPVLEAVDSFLFGIVLVIFAYGIAIGFVFTLPEGYGKRLPPLDEGRRRRPAQGDAGRSRDRGADRDLRPHRGGGQRSFAVVDAGVARLDPDDLGGTPHDRAWQQRRSEGGRCRALGRHRSERNG